MRWDGSNIQEVSHFWYEGTVIDWSPDGQSLILDTNPPESSHYNRIYRIEIEGASQRMLTDLAAEDDFAPRWSPDGQWVTFEKCGYEGCWLYRMQPDGTQVELLAKGASDAVWSPDGQWIIFRSFMDGRYEIARMRPDGSDKQNLTDDLPFSKANPVIAPNGQWVAFVANDQNSYSDVYRMRLDGSQKQNLTHSSKDEFAPQWSSTSEWLSFSIIAGSNGEIDVYRMKADGSAKQRIAQSDFFHASPQWGAPIDLPYHRNRLIGLGVAMLGGIFVAGWVRRR